MKLFLKIVAGVVVLIAIAVVAVFYMTSGMSKTATAFFNDIKAQHYSAAYSNLSEDFKTSTSQAQLQAFLEKSALLHCRDTSWTNRDISGGRGNLEGSVTTDSGGVVPIKLGFVKENGKWKIFSISKPQSGVTGDDQGIKMPSNGALVKLTDESMRKFAEGVNAKSFVKFHAYVSHIWQRQYSVAKFNKVFKPFIDANINMLPALQTSTPQFDSKPAINKDGILEVDGHYPTSPSRIIFKLKYIYEGINWKLFGLEVNIK